MDVVGFCVVVVDCVFEEVVPLAIFEVVAGIFVSWLTFDFGVWLMNESEGSVV